MNNYSEFEENTEKKVDFAKVLEQYARHWKWFVASVIVFLLIAFYYVEYTLPMYDTYTSIMLKDDQKGGGLVEMTSLKDFGLFTQKNNVDNELEVLNKSLVVEKVVKDLDLNVSYVQLKPYFSPGSSNWKYLPDFAFYQYRVLYGNECPFLISMPDSIVSNLKSAISFNVFVNPYGGYEFSGLYNKKKYTVEASISFNEVKLPFGSVQIKRGKFHPEENMLIQVLIQNPISTADQMLGRMKTELTSKTTSVVDVSLKTYNEQMGIDFLKKLVEDYNQMDKDEQTALADKTSKLIDERLTLLSQELGDVESQVENYKQQQGLTDIKSQSDLFIQQTGDFNQKKLDLQTQMGMISDLSVFINKPENRDQLIPVNSAIQSPALIELINNYNQLVLQRNKFSRIASSSNQAMIDLNNQIDAMFNTVKSSVENQKNNIQIAMNDLMAKNNENAAQIRAIPRQEREYTEINREQGVKESLFLFLLQKKEEKYLNLSLIEPVSKLIDNVRGSDGPVSPKKTLILFVALLAGIIFPVLIIRLLQLLRYHVETREELENMTTIPILGEIPKTSEKEIVLVKENKTDSFTELVRLLRTNLLFVLDAPEKKVVNVVSTMSGEGKTFITLNLAMSLAMLDKKVVIVELDIRRPRFAQYLGIKNDKGITSYLTGQMEKGELLKPAAMHPNIYIIPAGPIPPNPNELLAKELLDKLLVELRKTFDYILIDTAPVGVVSDSFTVNRLADATLYVVRANFTPKRGIEDAIKLSVQKRLTKMYFVLNGVDNNRLNYTYRPGKKYGYGYGYGEENPKKKKK